MALGRDVAEDGETRCTMNALVGGVQGFEASRDRSDEEKDADERKTCSRGPTGWRNLSDRP